MDSAISKVFFSQGILGVVCLLLITALVYMARALQKEHNERIGDLKEYADKTRQGNETMSDLVVEANKAVAQVSTDTQLSNREIAHDIAGLRTSVDSLKDSVSNLTSTVQNMRDLQIRIDKSLESRRLK